MLFSSPLTDSSFLQVSSYEHMKMERDVVEICGRVERLVWTNGDYAVAEVEMVRSSSDHPQETITVKGVMPQLEPGETFDFYGSFRDTEYGRHLEVGGCRITSTLAPHEVAVFLKVRASNCINQ